MKILLNCWLVTGQLSHLLAGAAVFEGVGPNI